MSKSTFSSFFPSRWLSNIPKSPSCHNASTLQNSSNSHTLQEGVSNIDKIVEQIHGSFEKITDLLHHLDSKNYCDEARRALKLVPRWQHSHSKFTKLLQDLGNLATDMATHISEFTDMIVLIIHNRIRNIEEVNRDSPTYNKDKKKLIDAIEQEVNVFINKPNPALPANGSDPFGAQETGSNHNDRRLSGRFQKIQADIVLFGSTLSRSRESTECPESKEISGAISELQTKMSFFEKIVGYSIWILLARCGFLIAGAVMSYCAYFALNPAAATATIVGGAILLVVGAIGWYQNKVSEDANRIDDKDVDPKDKVLEEMRRMNSFPWHTQFAYAWSMRPQATVDARELHGHLRSINEVRVLQVYRERLDILKDKYVQLHESLKVFAAKVKL
ncbi:unnamed protein product [Rhizoctonia solani]|uniref:Uncharacterized protein n=1 Tax=Rhizoctonia solani TaxID=456999 RepID=A0A8H3GPI2_9AGAM|nr:unnamed protein product [Rhizoctonia solani]